MENQPAEEPYRLYTDPLLRDDLSDDVSLQSQLDALAMADKRFGNDPGNPTFKLVRDEAEASVRHWIAGKGYVTSERRAEDSQDET